MGNLGKMPKSGRLSLIMGALSLCALLAGCAAESGVHRREVAPPAASLPSAPLPDEPKSPVVEALVSRKTVRLHQPKQRRNHRGNRSHKHLRNCLRCRQIRHRPSSRPRDHRHSRRDPLKRLRNHRGKHPPNRSRNRLHNRLRRHPSSRPCNLLQMPGHCCRKRCLSPRGPPAKQNRARWERYRSRRKATTRSLRCTPMNWTCARY